MRSTTKVAIWIGILMVTSGTVRAQEEEYETHINASMGTTISAPLNPSARFVNIGWGLTSGAGYNFTRKHAVIAEFMWNKLYPTSFAQQPVLFAFQRPGIGAYTNVYSVTGNYRYELRRNFVGVYFIGGGGWYDRSASIHPQLPINTAVSCVPAWIWWGYTCKSGLVTTSFIPSAYTSSTLGVNGGIGFTIRTGPAPYRVYVESRYHYAPTRTFNTQIIDVTLGIRY
jgi:hypothetical protein